MVQDFRHLSATRIVNSLLPEIQRYEEVTKKLKTVAKKCQASTERTRKSLDTMEKMTEKSGEYTAVHHSLTEAHRHNVVNSEHEVLSLRLQTKEFEEKKLQDLRKLLADFVRSEMIFHCKALEMYTAAARSISKWRIEEDLQEFLNAYDALSSVPKQKNPDVEKEQHMQADFSDVKLRASMSQPVLNEKAEEERLARKNQFLAGSLQPLTRAQSTTASTTSGLRRPQAAPRSVNRNTPLEESDSDD